jgi:(1->4)-alpha-D-glucan 1-alpha-D-glucosylmutase
LKLRRAHSTLFSCGKYVPLTVCGEAADHVIAFARHFEDECVVVVVPRTFHRMRSKAGKEKNESGVPRVDWTDTQVVLPEDLPQQWQCELSGRAMEPTMADDRRAFDVTKLFEIFPVAVLRSESD